MPSEPHPKNAPGDFYVEYGCCLCCDVPFTEAPGLFEYDESSHCFVKQQPRTDAELNQMMSAVACSETQCIRYRGHDPDIFERFGAIGDPSLCDYPPDGGIPIAIRNIATFVAKDRSSTTTPSKLIESFKRYLFENQSAGAWQEYRFTETKETGRASSFSYAWYEDDFHRVICTEIDEHDADFLVSYPEAGLIAISRHIHDWLTSTSSFANIRWYADPSWFKDGKSYDTPW